MTKKQSESVVLAKKLGIGEISMLTDQLLPLLEAEGEVTVDANEVESIDIAALQVLVAFSNSAASGSKKIHWQYGDGVVKQMALLSDLEQHIKPDPEIEVSPDDGLCPVF